MLSNVFRTRGADRIRRRTSATVSSCTPRSGTPASSCGRSTRTAPARGSSRPATASATHRRRYRRTDVPSRSCGPTSMDPRSSRSASTGRTAQELAGRSRRPTPSWSPDGSRIAFDAARGPCGICTIGSDDGRERSCIVGTDAVDDRPQLVARRHVDRVRSASCQADRARAQRRSCGSRPATLSGILSLDGSRPGSTRASCLAVVVPGRNPDRRSRGVTPSPRHRTTLHGHPERSRRRIDGRPTAANLRSATHRGRSGRLVMIVFDRTAGEAARTSTRSAPDGSDLTLVASERQCDARVATGFLDERRPVIFAVAVADDASGAGRTSVSGSPCATCRACPPDFDGNGTPDTASLATKMSDVGGCPDARDVDSRSSVVDLNGDGKADAVGRSTRLPTGCRPFGDTRPRWRRLGRSIAIVQSGSTRDGTSRIHLSDRHDPARWLARGDPVRRRERRPGASFIWGTVERLAEERAGRLCGVSCTSRTYRLAVVDGMAERPDRHLDARWHISEHRIPRRQHRASCRSRSTELLRRRPATETVFCGGAR